MRTLFRMFYKIDTKELGKVPSGGPLLMLVNHTSVLEGPMLYVFLQPRRVIAMAKKELWDHAMTAYLMKSWGCIPVDRGNMGRETMEACFGVLDRNDILAIAPEGTRSKDGNLQMGRAGVAFIAHKKQVPLLPVAITGFGKNGPKRRLFRRTRITISVGEPFEVVQKGGRLDAAGRQELIDEIMLRLAALMPEERRGYYRGKALEEKRTRIIEPSALA
jgi:1-acyl-sn-glycerol-3-phosphate acyltransferase